MVRKKKTEVLYSECLLCEYNNTPLCNTECVQIKNTCFNCMYLDKDNFHFCVIQGSIMEQGNYLNIYGTRIHGSKCESWRSLVGWDRQKQDEFDSIED